MGRHDRVLVVDDDPRTCETVRDLLGATGYTVETATSGRGGLDAVTRAPCDAAIVDIRLPDMSGLDLLQAIKTSSPATEVIVMTGHGSLSSAIQAISGRAFAYLEKPIEMDQLAATVDRALERKRTEEVLRRSEEAARALAHVGRELTGTLDLAQATDRIVSTVLRLFRVRRSVLYQLDPAFDSLACVAAAGEARPAHWIGQTLSVGVGVAGRAVARGQAVFTADLLSDCGSSLPDWLLERLETEGLRAGAAVPLVDRGETVGALALADAPGRIFTAEELRLLSAFADQAALAIRNARLIAEARKARDFLQSITENSADGIVTTDVRGRFTYVSPGAEEMFGYRAAEVLGRPAADFYRSGRAEARAVTKRLAREGRIRNYETAFRAKDGRWRTVSASISLIRGPDGIVTGTLGVIRDMTEHEAAESARREVAELRAITLVAGGVAHEIINPLTALMGQLEMLAWHLPKEGADAKRIHHASVAAERIANIVAQMTRITRIETTPTDSTLPPVLDIQRSSDTG